MRGQRAGTGLVIAGAAAAAVYFGFLRRWHLRWGATAQEATGEVAGDELMPDPDIVATRAVEIDAPPSAIWPWLVQMGPGAAVPTPAPGEPGRPGRGHSHAGGHRPAVGRRGTGDRVRHPANIVTDIAGQVIKTGHVTNSRRAALGVRVQTVAGSDGQPAGAVIAVVTPGLPRLGLDDRQVEVGVRERSFGWLGTAGPCDRVERGAEPLPQPATECRRPVLAGGRA
jgi:hypothetical protein